jgi:putative endonuclease
MTWKVYLLRCSDDSLYCGTTSDVERRLQKRNQGTGARYTRSKLPVEPVWLSDELAKWDAFKEEYRIKRLSKIMKEELVAGGTYQKTIFPRGQFPARAAKLWWRSPGLLS